MAAVMEQCVSLLLLSIYIYIKPTDSANETIIQSQMTIVEHETENDSQFVVYSVVKQIAHDLTVIHYKNVCISMFKSQKYFKWQVIIITIAKKM